ncbi:hypothetical protein ACIBEA_39805 [Streptomyces sp. NPDC051555]|uniref:hypothetical protein n=1 Tax=Streptomyces sp. NPDC051555 TaxID=3365657 RepID=UPI00378F68A0
MAGLPRRSITTDEAAVLHTLAREDLARAILDLQEDGATQAGMAEALGVNRSWLNMKISGFRATGRWPQRTHPASGSDPR